MAIAVGLRTAAGGTVMGMEEASLRALAKLEQVLPSRLRRRVNALQTYTVPMTGSGPTVDAEVLVAIASIPCRYQVAVTLHAPLDAMAECRCPGGTLEAIDDRTCLLRASADSLEWFAVSLGLLGVDFDVHEPPELVDHLALLADRYRRSGESGDAPVATPASA